VIQWLACGGAPVVINCSKSPYRPKDEQYMPISNEQCFLACCHVVDGVFSAVAVVGYKLKSKEPTFKPQSGFYSILVMTSQIMYCV